MTPAEIRDLTAERLARDSSSDERWAGIRRGCRPHEVICLRGSVEVEHCQSETHVPALGAITGNQAVQMVKAGS